MNGERDVKKLAALRALRIRASQETIAKSLVGDYRREHLLTLRQSVDLYRQYQRKIVECEKEMHTMMKALETKADLSKPLPAPKDSIKKRKVMNPERAIALHEEAYQQMKFHLLRRLRLSVQRHSLVLIPVSQLARHRLKQPMLMD